jgi:endonuclease YncB( thermonuclease family)
MKKLFNSSSLLIGLILVFIGVLTNRKSINGSTEKATANALPDDNYTELWQVKKNSVHDGDTLRVIKGQQEKKIRFACIDAPEIAQQNGIQSRDYLRSLVDKGDGTVEIEKVGDSFEAWVMQSARF